MVQVRKAVKEDIDFLYELIQQYADQGIMLPRSKETLNEQLDTFVVAESEGRLIGCGSLCALGSKLVEIRSLGMLPTSKGQGVGGRLVDFLVEDAKQKGFTQVMALTYEAKFFERQGFVQVKKEIFPEKVWKDCIHCKKFHCCDEIAVLREI
jgi:amino-acid N-acetyltransferase